MYIYLIKAGKKYKIGHSKNPENRMRVLQTANPNRCELVRKVKCASVKSSQEIEKQLHKHFRKDKLTGEWFRRIKLENFDLKVRTLFNKNPDLFSKEYAIYYYKNHYHGNRIKLDL